MQNKDVPYIVYESEQNRNEKKFKKLWIALIVAIVLIFASNAMWLYEWCQYDYESYEINSEDGGNANYIGESGDIYNGISESTKEN